MQQSLLFLRKRPTSIIRMRAIENVLRVAAPHAPVSAYCQAPVDIICRVELDTQNKRSRTDLSNAGNGVEEDPEPLLGIPAVVVSPEVGLCKARVFLDPATLMVVQQHQL